MGLGGGVPAKPEYGPIRVEGFSYEFRDKTDNCPKCEADRASFHIVYCTDERQEWLHVCCHCGFVWNELTADLAARLQAEVFGHFPNRAAVRSATAMEVNAIRERIITSHFTTQKKNAAEESGAK